MARRHLRWRARGKDPFGGHGHAALFNRVSPPYRGAAGKWGWVGGRVPWPAGVAVRPPGASVSPRGPAGGGPGQATPARPRSHARVRFFKADIISPGPFPRPSAIIASGRGGFARQVGVRARAAAPEPAVQCSQRWRAEGGDEYADPFYLMSRPGTESDPCASRWMDSGVRWRAFSDRFSLCLAN
jgi:hypothetical protein